MFSFYNVFFFINRISLFVCKSNTLFFCNLQPEGTYIVDKCIISTFSMFFFVVVYILTKIVCRNECVAK